MVSMLVRRSSGQRGGDGCSTGKNGDIVENNGMYVVCPSLYGSQYLIRLATDQWASSKHWHPRNRHQEHFPQILESIPGRV